MEAMLAFVGGVLAVHLALCLVLSWPTRPAPEE